MQSLNKPAKVKLLSNVVAVIKLFLSIKLIIFPSTSNSAVEPLNVLHKSGLSPQYAVLSPLNWILSPGFTSIDGADEPVFDVIDVHSPLFNLYSMVFAISERLATQLIVPADKILNVSGSVEKSGAAWYAVTLPVAVNPLYDAVNVNLPASWRWPSVEDGTTNSPVTVASDEISTEVPLS